MGTRTAAGSVRSNASTSRQGTSSVGPFGQSNGAQSYVPQAHQPQALRHLPAVLLSFDAPDPAETQRLKRSKRPDDQARLRQRRRAKPSPQGAPRQLEFRFAKLIDSVVAPILREARRVLAGIPDDVTESDANRILKQLHKAVTGALSDADVDKLAANLVREVGVWNATAVDRALGLESVGIKIPEINAKTASRLAKDAAKTIRGVPTELTRRAEPLVRNAALKGLRGKFFEKELAKRLGTTEKHARKIAVGQVIRVNAKLTEERHVALGIEEYEWHAKIDGHTRRWHKKLHGTRHRYDTPPEGGGGGPHDFGHAGSADTCRCQQIPVIPD